MIDNQEDKTFAVLKYDLSRYLPIRVVLRKDDNGNFHGLCEDSFSMSTRQNCVRIWWSGKAYSILGEHNLNGIEDAKYNAKPNDLIVDPLADDSPIEVDWQAWIAASDKFGKRNAPFKMKDSK